MLRYKLIHTGFLSPTHGHKHVHTAQRRSKAETQWRDLRGTVVEEAFQFTKENERRSIYKE